MLSGLNKNTLSIPFLVISTMVLLGSSYRYVRIFYPEINYFPYILELFLWLIVVLRLFFVGKIKINKIDFIMLLTLFLACISFIVLSLRYGLSSQLVFFCDICSSIVCIFLRERYSFYKRIYIR